MAAHGGAEADYNGVSEAFWGDVVFVNTIHPNRAQRTVPRRSMGGAVEHGGPSFHEG
jgi:hypothetical protein